MSTVKASSLSQAATVYPCVGIPVPTAVQIPSAMPLSIADGIILPQNPKTQAEVKEILRRHFQWRYKYRSSEVTRAFEDKYIVCDVAEILLNTVLYKPNILQKYFATGGNNVFGRFVATTPQGLPIIIFLSLFDLWNVDLLQTTFRYQLTDENNQILFDSCGNPFEVSFNAYGYFGSCSRTPLLAISSLYNNRRIPKQEDLVQMAYKICDEFNVNPDNCCSEEDFGFTRESPIQFSVLTEQVAIPNSIPVRGKGSGVRYLLKKEVDLQGNTAFLPVRNVCCLWHSITRPSYIRPAKPLFLYQDEIEKNDGRAIFMTSQLELAASLPPSFDYIFTSAWRLQDYVSDEQKLNWTIFRGRNIYYLLLTDKAHSREEFELAIAACNRIKQSGSGHPYIISVEKEN